MKKKNSIQFKNKQNGLQHSKMKNHPPSPKRGVASHPY